MDISKIICIIVGKLGLLFIGCFFAFEVIDRIAAGFSRSFDLPKIILWTLLSFLILRALFFPRRTVEVETNESEWPPKKQTKKFWD